MGKRFKIAFSFPGEKRAEVEAIAEALCGLIDKEKLFYDKYYEAELARADLDLYLQKIYRDKSELVVVFLCAAYGEKEWCGIEWAAVRELIKKRKRDEVMFVRFDKAEVEGVLSTYGYVEVDGRKGAEIAKVIFDRYQLNVAKKSSKGGATPHRKGATVHNLPFRSIRGLFKGRGDVLEELQGGLGDKATAITQTIHGLGGIGKTRLAVEFGWWAVREKRYEAVFFVNSETAELLHSSVASLAGEKVLGLVEEGVDQKIAESAVMGWVKGTGNWLMIFDNADTEEAAAEVEGLLPELARGHVIITSRYKRWGAAVKLRVLEVLEAGDAERFLVDRTAGRRVESGDDESVARELAEELGYLPLALEQAAAYIGHEQMTMGDYLEEWRSEKTQVLKWCNEREMNYPVSVAVTWERTFEKLSAAGRAVLRLAAYLAPEPIPIAMFKEGKDIVAEAAEGIAKESGKRGKRKCDIKKAVGELAAYSMIVKEAKSFTIHRIVQEVIRGRIGEDDKGDWIEKALRIVNDYAPTEADDVRTWDVWDAIRGHVEAVCVRADEQGISKPTARLMDRLGAYLQFKGLYEVAEPWFRRALEICKKSLGDKNPYYATILNDLGLFLKTTNRPGEAEPLYQRVLEIYEESLGSSHPWVATALNNLAALLKDTNRLDEAEPMMRRALAIDEESLGKDHPDVAIRLNNMAQLLRATNRLDEAERVCRRALEIRKKSLGDKHPDYATSLNELAGLLYTTNRLDEAEPLYHQVLEIYEESFGNDHPWVAAVLNNLALLLRATNRLDEAEPMYTRAVEIFEKSLGAEHPMTVTARRNLEILRSKM